MTTQRRIMRTYYKPVLSYYQGYGKQGGPASATDAPRQKNRDVDSCGHLVAQNTPRRLQA